MVYLKDIQDILLPKTFPNTKLVRYRENHGIFVLKLYHNKKYKISYSTVTKLIGIIKKSTKNCIIEDNQKSPVFLVSGCFFAPEL